MSAIAYLGAVSLDVLQVAGFDSSRAWRWVSHDTLEDLPKLEPRGRAASTPALRIKLHPELGPVEPFIASLEALGDREQVEPLILASGRLVGWFVLESVDLTRQRTADDGTLIEGELKLQLREGRAPLDPDEGPLAGVEGSASPERTDPILVDTTGDPNEVPLSEIARN